MITRFIVFFFVLVGFGNSLVLAEVSSKKAGTASAKASQKKSLNWSPTCDKILSSVQSGERTLEDEGINPEDFNRVLADMVGSFIEKYLSVPTHEELASQLKVEPSQITSYFKRPDTPQDLRQLVEISRTMYGHYYEKPRNKFLKAYAVYFKQHETFPSISDMADVMDRRTKDIQLIFGDFDKAKEQAMSEFPSYFSVIRNKIKRAFINQSKMKGVISSVDGVASELDWERSKLESMFGDGGLFTSFEEFFATVIVEKSSIFSKVQNPEVYTEARRERLLNAIKNRKRLILTTALEGVYADEEKLKALVVYAEKMDAEIIVIPALMRTMFLDRLLLETDRVHILTHSVELNEWLAISNTPLVPKLINPVAALEETAFKEGQGQILGSPQMVEKTLPHILNALNPQKFSTTGAITKRSYQGQKIISARTDQKAMGRHVMGALVLEKGYKKGATFPDGNGFYHSRHIEFVEPLVNKTKEEEKEDEENPKPSGFYDLGVYYSSDGTVEFQGVEAVVLGDIHVGVTDQYLLDAIKRQIFTLRPKRIYLHDLFNGHSISHHEREKIITMAKKAQRGELDLKQELEQVAAFLNGLFSFAKSIGLDLEVIVVPSNHNEWLPRYLQDKSRFGNDILNGYIANKLEGFMRDGDDPLENALKDGIMDKFDDQVVLQPVDKEFRSQLIFVNESMYGMAEGPAGAEVEVSKHGHRGINGARGSLVSFFKSMARGIFGHTHTYARINGVVNVGTSTVLDQHYVLGSVSSWVQSLGLIHKDGSIQALSLKGRNFYLDSETEAQRDFSSEAFFPENYPFERRNTEELGSQFRDSQVDWWSSYSGG